MTSIGNIFNSGNNTVAQPTPLTATTPASTSSGSGLSFGDVLDAVNPLQHIPVLSGLYRAISGTSISPTAQVAGDTLYGAAFGGALIGLASSVANVAVQKATGEDISQHVVNTIGGIGGSSTASASTTPSTTVTPLTASTAAAAVPTASSILPDMTTMSGQLTNAMNAIYHPSNANGYDAYTNSHYQTVTSHDAINKQLLKMAI